MSQDRSDVSTPDAPAKTPAVDFLVADNDVVTLHYLERTLSSWDFSVHAVQDGFAAYEFLRSNDPPSLAILDWTLPGMDGPSICRHLRSQADRPYTYIVLLTGRTDPGELIEGILAGADDYLLKPFARHELDVRVRAGQRIVRLHNDVITARLRLAELATHDPMTGVQNRQAILGTLRAELARSRRTGSPLATLLIDVDDFKQINDAYGQLAGDQILCEVAQRIERAMRSYEAVGRYSDDGFLAVLSSCMYADGEIVAERIQGRLASEPIRTSRGNLQVTASVGLAVGDGSETDDELIRAATTALGRAKSTGGNRLEISRPQ